MKKIKSLIIGLGNVGLLYDLPRKKTLLSHSLAISKHKSYELLGGVDKKLKNRKIFKKFYKKPSFASVKSALLKLKPKIIIVSTPTKTHLKILKEIMSFKNIELSSIVMEKPTSFKNLETREMLKICKRHNIKLFVNYPFVYDSALKIIKKKIKSQNQKNFITNITYSKGAYHIASHLIKICIFFFGKPVKYLNINSINQKDDFYFNGIIYFKKTKVYFNYSRMINTKIIDIILSDCQIIIDINSMNVWKRDKVKKLDQNNFNVLDRKYTQMKNSQKDIQYFFYEKIKKKIIKSKKIIQNNYEETFVDNYLERLKNAK